MIFQYYMRRLYHSDAGKDIVLIAKNGEEMKVHGFILKARGPLLTELVRSVPPSRKLYFGDFSDTTINLFLRYLYSQEMFLRDISCNVSLELLQIAQRYQQMPLKNTLAHFIEWQEMEWFTNPDALTDLYAFFRDQDGFEEVSAHLLDLMNRAPAPVAE